MTETDVRSRYVRISLMMFLQFFTWGSWFSTLFMILGKHDLASIIGKSYGTAPIAAMVAPLFLGLIADRFFSSERLMGVMFLIGGLLMQMVPSAIAAGNASLVVTLFTGHMLCYMPTLGLGNTIAFSHLPRDIFPKTRVWGTIGWITAGLVAGFLGWSDSLHLFRMAGISALLLGLFCFMLPHTPPPSQDKPVDLRALFMVDAFRLLAKPAFFVFMLCSMLICIPLAYYFNSTSGFLSNMGFQQPASAMTIGQMSEIFFMLLVPFFFRKLGVKWMIIVAMLCWVMRYALFAYGATQQSVLMIFAAIALHGICYDFFFVTGFMYADRVAPEAIRGQTQSMLVFFTQGVGMFIGYDWAAKKFAVVQPASDALGAAIAAENPVEKMTYAQKLAQMFAAEMPHVDHAIWTKAAGLWQSYWLFPALLAGAIAILFFLAFWDRSKSEE